MWAEMAVQALREAKCLRISYGRHERIVEVHAVGCSREGNGLMLVWQVRGGSRSKVPVGWKLLRLDETWNYGIIDEPSYAPRPGYAGSNKAIARVIAEL